MSKDQEWLKANTLRAIQDYLERNKSFILESFHLLFYHF